ncbi:MAG: peptidase S41, partial [Marinilabilia sp.]
VNLPDSVIFKTKERGRNVYGGGGIVPDVFLPVDTSHYTDYYRDLVASGSVNRYVIDKLADRRDEWQEQYDSFSDFQDNFEIPDLFIEELVEEGEENDIALEEDELETSESWLKLQMKALIARNIWSTSEYYQTLNPALPFFDQVLNLIEDKDLYSETFGADE